MRGPASGRCVARRHPINKNIRMVGGNPRPSRCAAPYHSIILMPKVALEPDGVSQSDRAGLNPFYTMEPESMESGKIKHDTPSSSPKDTISLFLQIPPREIAYLNFVLDSYEGVASMRTVDPRAGIVELMVSPSYQEEIKEILKDLAEEFPIQEVGGKKGV